MSQEPKFNWYHIMNTFLSILIGMLFDSGYSFWYDCYLIRPDQDPELCDEAGSTPGWNFSNQSAADIKFIQCIHGYSHFKGEYGFLGVKNASITQIAWCLLCVSIFL